MFNQTQNIFADDSSLYMIINDLNATDKQLCEDLNKRKQQAFQRKLRFNPEPSKQAQVIFTRKVNKVVHRPIFFNNKPVQQVLSQKHLGLLYDEHNNAITSKFSKTIGLLPKLDNHLSWPPLITIYKSFKRPHVDYSDVMFDKAYKNSFQQRLESLQYKA